MSMPNSGKAAGLKMSKFSRKSNFPFRYGQLGVIRILYVKC